MPYNPQSHSHTVVSYPTVPCSMFTRIASRFAKTLSNPVFKSLDDRTIIIPQIADWDRRNPCDYPKDVLNIQGMSVISLHWPGFLKVTHLKWLSDLEFGVFRDLELMLEKVTLKTGEAPYVSPFSFFHRSFRSPEPCGSSTSWPNPSVRSCGVCVSVQRRGWHELHRKVQSMAWNLRNNL